MDFDAWITHTHITQPPHYTHSQSQTLESSHVLQMIRYHNHFHAFRNTQTGHKTDHQNSATLTETNDIADSYRQRV